MRSKIAIAVLSCLLAGVVAFAAEPPKQDKPAAQPAGPDMAAFQKAITPGEQQKQLARLVGDWTFTNKAWMAPGQPPAESTGTMHAETLMGGRYVEHHWSGNFMGMPFEGRGTEAYDNVMKQYVSTWIDTMGTGIMTQTGTCEDGGKKCTYKGSTSDPMSGAMVPMRSVITWVDNDTFTNEMFGNDPSGKEMKMMEITAKRKK